MASQGKKTTLLTRTLKENTMKEKKDLQQMALAPEVRAEEGREWRRATPLNPSSRCRSI